MLTDDAILDELDSWLVDAAARWDAMLCDTLRECVHAHRKTFCWLYRGHAHDWPDVSDVRVLLNKSVVDLFRTLTWPRCLKSTNCMGSDASQC